MGLHLLPLLVGVSGFAMALAPALQLHRILRRRAADDVSVGVFATVCAGTTMLAVYGVDLHAAALAVPNTVSALMNAAVVAVALRYRSVRSGEPLRAETD